MEDLYHVLIKDIHVGCNVHEIQLMKEDLQAFQETAKVGKAQTQRNSYLGTMK